MAKAPLRIADALGFGGSSKPYVSPYLREVSKIKRGEKLPGTITRAPRPSAATQLAQILTPNTRFGNELAAKIAPAVEMSPLGILTGLVDARRAYQEGNTANAAGLGILAALGAVPGGKGATIFDTVRDAGMGQVFRRTPEGAYITVMENSKYAPRPNSVTDFVVPEELRGKGIGGKMLDEIFSIYGPETISAAASSIPSVKAFYKRGLRPGRNPNATLDDAIKIMKEDSSVTMIKPKEDFIDWDTPISGQSEKVNDALDHAGILRKVAGVESEIDTLRNVVKSQGFSPTEKQKKAMSDLAKRRFNLMQQSGQLFAPRTPS